MNRYLARLRSLNSEKQVPTQTLKTLKTGSGVGFEGFEGLCESPFSKNRGSLIAEKVSCGNPQNPQNPTADDDRLTAALWPLETPPAFIPEPRWRQAIEDGQAFLDQWREQALALGWTGRDLFGLHEPPAKAHPSYCRLGRYDATGLIWLLQGQRVLAMTEQSATISTPSGGSLTHYRKAV